MAAPRPGNTDRGWNDPPVFDYQGHSILPVGSPHAHHTKLNKRVAYPLSTTSNADSPATAGTATLLNPSDGPPRLPPVQILPPSSTTVTPTPVPLLIPMLSPTTDPCGDSSQQPAIFSPTAATVPGTARPVAGGQAQVKAKDLPALLADLSLTTEENLLEYVKSGLTSAADSMKEALQGRALEEVKRKVGLMADQWTSGKMSASVKSELGSLVAALNKEAVEEAHERHLALMINHTAEVNHWLVAVKRIIQELRSKATTAEENQTDAQAPVTDPCALPETLALQASAISEENQSTNQLPESSEQTETSSLTQEDRKGAESSVDGNS